jgi:hypothetical protein
MVAEKQTEQEGGFWSDADVISVYTRAQAIDDGELVDVSETASEAGFRYPVAVTRAVWAMIENIPASKRGQDVAGRLWDVLWIAKLQAKRVGGMQTMFSLIMHHGRKSWVTFKMYCGPGDEGEPVITIMLPDED